MIADLNNIEDICSTCHGKGYVTFNYTSKQMDKPLMRVVLISIIALLLFYAFFIIYITFNSVNFLESVIILFAGHMVLATSLVLYLIFKALKQ